MGNIRRYLINREIHRCRNIYSNKLYFKTINIVYTPELNFIVGLLAVDANLELVYFDCSNKFVFDEVGIGDPVNQINYYR